MKKTAHVLAWLVLGAPLVAAMAFGCAAGAGAEATAGAGGATVCQPGTFRDCSCGALDMGTQACSNDGSWGTCTCLSSSSSSGQMDGGNDAASVCNDGVCNGTENCVDCPADCGMCPSCGYAPGCTGASSVPATPMALPSFNYAGMSMFTSGVGFGESPEMAGCSYPLLKMRLSQVVVHKNGDPGNLEMFCIVQADDGQSSQIMVSPDFTKIGDNNPPLTISPAQGTFWGEAVNGVKLSQFNITVTYQCFMVLQAGVLQKALTAIAGYAGAAASIPGNPYGWAFAAGGAAAAAGAAIAATGNGATPLLNVQQTIDQSALLKLTNGYTWTIEQTGSTTADGHCNVFSSCDWDWELDIEAWGCAAPKGQIPVQ